MTNNDIYDGKFIFGGYNMSYAKKGLGAKDIFWADMHTNHYYWVLNMGTVAFKEQEKEGEAKAPKPFKLDIASRLAALDTGMSLSMIPVEDFVKLTTYLSVEHGLEFLLNDQNHMYYTVCTGDICDNLPDLRVTFLKNAPGKTGSN